MQEEFLHFIFKYRLWETSALKLISGERLEIIDVGQHNFDSGPDFFNAKISIDGIIWVGNLEIHINASDWYKHNHHKDFAYNNVILHVVFNYDKPVFVNNNQEIPAWEMQFPHVLYNKYAELKLNEKIIPCADYFELVDENIVSVFLESQAIERLEAKTLIIQEYLNKSNNNWEEAFYLSLARSFGFGINSEPFEQLALATPLKLVRKYSTDVFLLEALFYGQAGLLNNVVIDDYLLKLQKEYKFLQQKHNLTPILCIWKTSKMRPNNFAQVRIAQFAQLMTNFQGLFSNIIDEKLDGLCKFFKVCPSVYWRTHFVFGKPVDKANTNLGVSAYNIIAINTLAPFLFHYYKYCGNNNSYEIVVNWLTSFKAEDNREVRAWKTINLIPNNAFESQALLNLKKEYCDKKKCIDCTIGFEIMKALNNID